MVTETYLEDLRSDFRAIHRVDEIELLEARVFAQLAIRCAAYDGVITARIEALQAAEEGGYHQAIGPPSGQVQEMPIEAVPTYGVALDIEGVEV